MRCWLDNGLYTLHVEWTSDSCEVAKPVKRITQTVKTYIWRLRSDEIVTPSKWTESLAATVSVSSRRETVSCYLAEQNRIAILSREVRSCHRSIWVTQTPIFVMQRSNRWTTAVVSSRWQCSVSSTYAWKFTSCSLTLSAMARRVQEASKAHRWWMPVFLAILRVVWCILMHPYGSEPSHFTVSAYNSINCTRTLTSSTVYFLVA